MVKANLRRIGFYDLPAEVRNLIAQYVFIHIGVCPTSKASEKFTGFERIRRPFRPPRRHIKVAKQITTLLAAKAPTHMLTGVEATQWNPKSRPFWGFQLLASCTRAYHEYHAMFYTSNAFCIAPGDPQITRLYFSGMNKKHWKMIPLIIVYFGILDITPHAMVQIEYATRNIFNKIRALVMDSASLRATRFLISVERYLTTCWLRKLKWLRRNVKGKPVVLLNHSGQSSLILSPMSAHMPKKIDRNLNGVCPQIQGFLRATRLHVGPRLEGAIQEAFIGYAGGIPPRRREAIDRFKQWLAKQEEQENLNKRMREIARRPRPPKGPIYLDACCREPFQVG